MLSQVKDFLSAELSSQAGRAITIERWQRVSGGSINETYQVVTNEGETYFLKYNNADKFPGLFQDEMKSLEHLQQFIRAPGVRLQCDNASFQLLLLEWIEPGARTPGFWRSFGEQLAQLHRQTHTHFGFSSDNYMGALRQVNTYTDNWVNFFIRCRIRPQVELATRNGLMPVKHLDDFEKLYELLPPVFPSEPPALLHGDLWSGNFICTKAATPVLVDPAVYYGHRSMDLAMTTLFGQFDKQFYEAYHYHFPFPDNYEEQWSIANLYPLLIHLNLFGTGYLSSVTASLQHHISKK